MTSTARISAQHPGVVRLGQAGWFAKGVVYLLAGYLALALALREWGSSITPGATGGQEASPTGAIKTVAGSTGGGVLLWLLAIGMLLYAAWRIVSGLLLGGRDASALAHRVGYIVSAIVYITFAVSAIGLARDSSVRPDGNRDVTDISASVMAHRAGRIAIGLAGVVIMIVGLYRISKGLRSDVMDELDHKFSARRARWTQHLGAVGEVGRGLGIGLVGFFLLRSALSYDAAEATGLDGALRRTLVAPGGVAVVAAVAVGLAAYGLFCLVTFTHRRLETP
ncbi:MAG: DUF1206 domain-containing protein [Actinomycetota bacterium]